MAARQASRAPERTYGLDQTTCNGCLDDELAYRRRKPSTPTPRGEFFVEEAIQLRAADVGAPFALALSGRSNVFQEFDGGPGQIGLHGLANIGGVLGSAVSHRCVRLDNGMMRWLVVRIGPGVPVTITS